MLGRRDYIHNRLCKYIYVCVWCDMEQNGMVWYGMACMDACMHGCMHAWMYACMHACMYALTCVLLCYVAFCFET